MKEYLTELLVRYGKKRKYRIEDIMRDLDIIILFSTLALDLLIYYFSNFYFVVVFTLAVYLIHYYLNYYPTCYNKSIKP
jgi:hypothetical protein